MYRRGRVIRNSMDNTEQYMTDLEFLEFRHFFDGEIYKLEKLITQLAEKFGKMPPERRQEFTPALREKLHYGILVSFARLQWIIDIGGDPYANFTNEQKDRLYQVAVHSIPEKCISIEIQTGLRIAVDAMKAEAEKILKAPPSAKKSEKPDYTSPDYKPLPKRRAGEFDPRRDWPTKT